jgi:hypothetical protein
MATTFRSLTTGALLVSVTTLGFGSSLLAAEPPATSHLRIALPSALTQPVADTDARVATRNPFAIDDSLAFARYGRSRRGHGWHNEAAVAAVVLGAAASITGGALLVYANRPECGTTPTAGGCSYGTKVVGGAVLAGGVVSMTAGALMWRR